MISVVIPLYNKSLTIGNTISSVLNQSCQDFEVVIVDDGSTDNSVEVVNQYVSDSSKIRLFHQANQGVCAARNKGVYESKGEFVAFLDADDLWHPRYLELMNNMIKDKPDAGMYCSAGFYSRYDGKGKLLRIANKYPKPSQHIDFFENPVVFSHTSATVVSKEKFLKVGGFVEGMKCCEDMRTFRILALYYPVMYCGWPISKYVCGVPSAITGTDKDEIRTWQFSYVTQYYNDIYDEMMKLGGVRCNHNAYLWFKFAVRGRILGALKSRDKELLHYIIANYKFMEILRPVEKRFYLMDLDRIAICWVYFTKAIWRLHGYPVFREKLKNREIPKEFLEW